MTGEAGGRAAARAGGVSTLKKPHRPHGLGNRDNTGHSDNSSPSHDNHCRYGFRSPYWRRVGDRIMNINKKKVELRT